MELIRIQSQGKTESGSDLRKKLGPGSDLIMTLTFFFNIKVNNIDMLSEWWIRSGVDPDPYSTVKCKSNQILVLLLNYICEMEAFWHTFCKKTLDPIFKFLNFNFIIYLKCFLLNAKTIGYHWFNVIFSTILTVFLGFWSLYSHLFIYKWDTSIVLYRFVTINETFYSETIWDGNSEHVANEWRKICLCG